MIATTISLSAEPAEAQEKRSSDLALMVTLIVRSVLMLPVGWGIGGFENLLKTDTPVWPLAK
jgi:hypothetical protein